MGRGVEGRGGANKVLQPAQSVRLRASIMCSVGLSSLLYTDISGRKCSALTVTSFP